MPMHTTHDPRPIVCRGVCGATVAADNTREAIYTATRELLIAVTAANGIHDADLASVCFTTTPDLDAAVPHEAMRHAGWEYVPMLSMVAMDKPGAPPRCIRVLLHWNTAKTPREIKHIYLRGTEKIRSAGLAEIAAAP